MNRKNFFQKASLSDYLSKEGLRNNCRVNRKTTKSRKQKWEEKQVYGYFKQQTKRNAYLDTAKRKPAERK